VLMGRKLRDIQLPALGLALVGRHLALGESQSTGACLQCVDGFAERDVMESLRNPKSAGFILLV
jgi:hypothetical protein